MNSKQLIILTGVAAALAGAAVWSSRNEARQTLATGIGERVLPSLKDKINDITSLSVESATSTVTVSRVGDTWRVPGKWNYPADFAKVREALNRLAELKVLQPLRTSPATRADLQLLTPHDPGATNLDGRAACIRLTGADRKTVAMLYAGKTRSRPGASTPAADFGGMGSFPDGQYVMTEQGQACLIGEVIQELTLTAQNWLDAEFINFSDLLSLQVTGASGGGYHASRSTPGGDLVLAEPVPAGKEADATKLSQAASVLGYLRFEDVADPALTAEKTGLDKPVTFQARNQKGEVVTVRIGQPVAGDSRRFATVAVAFEAPALPAGAAGTNQEAVVKAQTELNAKTAAATKTLNDKLSPWVYQLPRDTAETLTWGLSDLLKDKPKAEEKNDGNKP